MDSFNSRAHEGRDVEADEIVRRFQVSIHAPTRGATRPPLPTSSPSGFQFTRPRGARQPDHAVCGNRLEFQFTRPRGARPHAQDSKLFLSSFNSRAHEGRDIGFGHGWPLDCVSIHAPTRGATPIGSSFRPSITFQFTRPRGARPSANDIPQDVWMFQFTRPRGARPITRPTRSTKIRFNSRAHEGRD